ncbi:hypothetical protein MMC11_008724 [Xylographa trunciseda]|nr:hypothetical protein [Xylographa trunciseda]
MEFFEDNLKWERKADKPLRILVVGAGIGGLAVAIGLKQSGHDVVILEQVPHIAEVGAGIQMAPNAARILGRFGLLEKVMEKANVLEKNSLRRYANNEELGTAPLMPEIGQKYGAPLSVIHRGDLQAILLEAARAEKIEMHLGSRVLEADPEFEARVKLQSGEWLKGDVIIAADGIKSDLRRQIAKAHGIEDRSQPTGDAAYRILIPKEKLEHDPEALDLLNTNVGMRWMGPEGHIMAYPIKNNQVYNMYVDRGPDAPKVLLHPQKAGAPNEESWTNRGDKKEMLDFYSSWNDLVKNLLTYVPEGDVMEWTLNTHRPLPAWIENKVALIGDACHPMLPYVAQGAANAIEDAGTLTMCFSITSDVPLALEIYQYVRKTRGEAIQQSAATTRKALHLPDGPEQYKRDEAIRTSKHGGHNPDLWADTEWQQFMWGVDVMKDTLENWDTYKGKVEGHHLTPLNATIYT